MQKIHVDTTMGIHINNGIVHIILGSDDLSKKFFEKDQQADKELKATNIISMPISGFIETLNIFENFVQEPHIKMALDNYVKVGVLSGSEDEQK